MMDVMLCLPMYLLGFWGCFLIRFYSSTHIQHPSLTKKSPTITQQNNNNNMIIPSELPIIGAPNWFLLTLLSPYAGIYYWKSGDRVDDMKVKLATNDDETLNEITIEGNDEEIDRMWRTLDLREKGMVKVEGILG